MATGILQVQDLTTQKLTYYDVLVTYSAGQLWLDSTQEFKPFHCTLALRHVDCEITATGVWLTRAAQRFCFQDDTLGLVTYLQALLTPSLTA